jgi:hypothetical protein
MKFGKRLRLQVCASGDDAGGWARFINYKDLKKVETDEFVELFQAELAAVEEAHLDAVHRVESITVRVCARSRTSTRSIAWPPGTQWGV